MSYQGSQEEQDGPFAELLGIRPGESADGVGTAFMTVEDKHRQRAGVVQGGILVALADYALLPCLPFCAKRGRARGNHRTETELHRTGPGRRADGPQRHQESRRSYHRGRYGDIRR